MANRTSRGAAKNSRSRKASAPQPQLFPEEASSGKVMRMMYSLPPRFKAYSEPDRHMVRLVDEETGKEVQIAIGAYGEVRRTLGALFGGEEEEMSDYIPPSVDPTVNVVPASPAEPEVEPPAPQPPKAAKTAAKRSGKADEPVIIPPPEKKLFGAALSNYKRKWLIQHDYAPDQKAEIGEPAAVPEPEAAPEQSAPEKSAAKPAKEARKAARAPSEPVQIPAPEKRIFGIALKNYMRKWLSQNGYDPDQPAVIADTSTAKSKEVAKPAAGQSKAEQRQSEQETASAAADDEDKDTAVKTPAQQGRRRGPKANPPEGWESVIQGEGYWLEYGRDPERKVPAYRVMVEGDHVGWLRQEGPTRFVLYSPTEVWSTSIHRNVFGAQTRLDVMYEKD